VEIWRSSNKNNNAHFFSETRCKCRACFSGSGVIHERDSNKLLSVTSIWLIKDRTHCYALQNLNLKTTTTFCHVTTLSEWALSCWWPISIEQRLRCRAVKSRDPARYVDTTRRHRTDYYVTTHHFTPLFSCCTLTPLFPTCNICVVTTYRLFSWCS